MPKPLKLKLPTPVVALLLLLPPASLLAAPMQPDFGPNVLIFDPSGKTIQNQIDSVFSTQERGEFNSNRYALLFKPGKYNLDVQMGFYTQAAGLGYSPEEVAITGALRSNATWMHGNATINFWRCAENLSLTTLDRSADVWAVSQGTALRRIHLKGNLNLWDGGWSSGGFIADSRIDGQVNSGSQQQWLSRNTRWDGWHGGAWNMVFLGVENPPAGSWPAAPYTVVDKTPVIVEKPYLFLDSDGHYSVMVPNLHKDLRGTTWGDGVDGGTTIPIEQFYLAHPDKDDAASINTALAAGKNLLLTPGIYHLQDSIRVSRTGTVVLGLGYPTLVPDRGTAAIVISDVSGIRVAGIILDAGAVESPTLLQVGERPAAPIYADPIFLYDIFCRAGGATPGATRSFVTINADNVIGDNLWLWRADHGAGASWNTNRVANGLVVNGDDVTIYGLFVEHCQEYQTLWNGNGGRVYFYQSEMPYDPPSQADWSHDTVKGYASYKVADGVKTHEAWGMGIYCVFTSAPVVADSAIEVPRTPGIRMHDMVIARFGGQHGSGINHVINDSGVGIISKKSARQTDWPSP
jgi:hypothetical protein